MPSYAFELKQLTISIIDGTVGSWIVYLYKSLPGTAREISHNFGGVRLDFTVLFYFEIKHNVVI